MKTSGLAMELGLPLAAPAGHEDPPLWSAGGKKGIDDEI